MKREKRMTREKGKEKYVYRAKMLNIYQIGEMESWFTDMAAEGCHLDKSGVFRFRFKKGGPQNMKYRIDMKQDTSSIPEAELMEAYREHGWEYVTKFGEFRVFRSPEEAQAPELHTDPAEQAFTLCRLEKRLTWNAVCIVLASVIIALLYGAIWFLDEMPVQHFFEDQTLQQAFLLIVYIYLVTHCIWETMSLRRLCKSLREGRAIDHHVPWKKSRRRAKVMLLLVLILEIPVLAVPAIHLPQSINPNYSELPAADMPQPFVRLGDIEKSPQLVLDEEGAGTAYGNGYIREWGIFTAEEYGVQERGEIPGRSWADESGIYSPSLTTKIYRLRLSGVLAQSLAKELVFQYRDIEGLRMNGSEVEELKDDRFDYAIIVRESTRLGVSAVRGNLVMHLCYYGEANTNHLLDLIDEKLR